MASKELVCPHCGVENEHQHTPAYDGLDLNQKNVQCGLCGAGWQYTAPIKAKKEGK